jgi:hypothetical protein
VAIIRINTNRVSRSLRGSTTLHVGQQLGRPDGLKVLALVGGARVGLLALHLDKSLLLDHSFGRARGMLTLEVEDSIVNGVLQVLVALKDDHL